MDDSRNREVVVVGVGEFDKGWPAARWLLQGNLGVDIDTIIFVHVFKPGVAPSSGEGGATTSNQPEADQKVVLIKSQLEVFKKKAIETHRIRSAKTVYLRGRVGPCLCQVANQEQATRLVIGSPSESPWLHVGSWVGDRTVQFCQNNLPPWVTMTVIRDGREVVGTNSPHKITPNTPSPSEPLNQRTEHPGSALTRPSQPLPNSTRPLPAPPPSPQTAPNRLQTLPLPEPHPEYQASPPQSHGMVIITHSSQPMSRTTTPLPDTPPPPTQQPAQVPPAWAAAPTPSPSPANTAPLGSLPSAVEEMDLSDPWMEPEEASAAASMLARIPRGAQGSGAQRAQLTTSETRPGVKAGGKPQGKGKETGGRVEDLDIEELLLNRYELAEIYKATNVLESGNKIESGRGGSSMWRGVVDSNVSVTINEVPSGSENFRREIDVMKRISHKNVATLLGYCSECGTVEGIQRGPFQVLEFASVGSLGSFLGPTSLNLPLTWMQRKVVIVGAARGLRYLHEFVPGGQILHRNVCRQNILLDEKLEPLVANFSAAQFYEDKEERPYSSVFAEAGYMPPEALNGIVTERSDVYSYGVLVLEIITGMLPIDTHRGPLVQLALVQQSNPLKMADKQLEGDYNMSEFEFVFWLALQCTQSDHDARPLMKQVVYLLEKHLTMPERLGSSHTSELRPVGEISGSFSAYEESSSR